MIATRRPAAITLGLALWTGSAAALAQTAGRDPAAAEALFERGKQLVDQGRTAEACEAFAGSQRLDPPGERCCAWRSATRCKASSPRPGSSSPRSRGSSREGAGEPAKLQERVRIAREHLAAIEPRIPKLVVSVPTASRTEGLRVTASGLPRDEGTWAVALPADPGDVEIVASAPGHVTFRTTVHLAEGRQEAVEVPPLPLAAAVDRAPDATSRSSPLRPAGLVVGALGVVALGVGTYFGVRAIGDWHDASAACPSSQLRQPLGRVVRERCADRGAGVRLHPRGRRHRGRGRRRALPGRQPARRSGTGR